MAELGVIFKIKPTERLKKHFKKRPSCVFNLVISVSDIKKLELSSLNILGKLCMQEWCDRLRYLGASEKVVKEKVWGKKRNGADKNGKTDRK